MLYLVPTPIGNLDDMTFRAVDTLKKVAFVLAEDTRTSRKLLEHFDIKTPLRPYHTHNEHYVVQQLILELRQADVALISDAGTPSISDPGFLLVRACIENDITVSCLPGATACVPALAMAAFPIQQFHYEGFLPHKKGRQTRLKWLAEVPNTFVLYESPHRLVRCLEELKNHCSAQRKAVVCREISKLYEQNHRGTLEELQTYFEQNPDKVRGEIVVVVEGKPLVKTAKYTQQPDDDTDE